MTPLHQVENPIEETSPANLTGCFWSIKGSNLQGLRLRFPEFPAHMATIKPHHCTRRCRHSLSSVFRHGTGPDPMIAADC